MTKNKQTITNLTLMGLLPFLISTFLSIFNISFFSININASFIFITYGSIILSFLAGTTWGVVLRSEKPRPLLFITSNAVAILAWIAAMNAQYTSLYILLVGFAIQLLVDRRLTLDHTHAKWYYNIRKNVTYVVIICTVIIMAAKY